MPIVIKCLPDFLEWWPSNRLLLQPQPVRLVYFGPGVEVLELAHGHGWQPLGTCVLPENFEPVIAAVYGDDKHGSPFGTLYDVSECGRPANMHLVRCTRPSVGGVIVVAQSSREVPPSELRVADWKAVQPPPHVMRAIIQAQVDFARG